MNLITKLEYSERIGKPTNYLSVVIGRGNVIETANGMIDLDEPKNRAYLNKKIGKSPYLRGVNEEIDRKKAAGQLPRSETYVPAKDFTVRPASGDDGDYEDSGSDDGVMELDVSEKRYKHFLAVKTERESQIKEIEIEKRKGMLVPSEPIVPIFLQHNQHILAAMKSADEEILTDYGHKYNISNDDMAFIRGRWVDVRNEAMQKATAATELAVKNIINDYSEKRGVGQRI